MDVRTWIDRQRSSHDRRDREEAARMRAMTPEERGRLLKSLCDSAMRALLALPEHERDKALAFRAPLPASSVAALRRLREEHARTRAGR